MIWTVLQLCNYELWEAEGCNYGLWAAEACSYGLWATEGFNYGDGEVTFAYIYAYVVRGKLAYLRLR